VDAPEETWAFIAQPSGLKEAESMKAVIVSRIKN
jgi:hypothetical protein